jgi:hypothetical protein
MISQFRRTTLLAIAAWPFVSAWALTESSPAPPNRLPTAEVFAPGVISGPANDGAPTFSRDGNTLFFTRSTSHWSSILESHKERGTWSAPVIAPFSGEWPDSSPAFSPDGAYLIFVSVRRAASGAAESHIWRVNRTDHGWSAPLELPASVNRYPWIFRPSIAADGSIYFTAALEGKNLSLFKAQYAEGSYQRAEPLAFSDGSVKDVDPEIAPDQSFLIFSSRRAFPGESEHEHLFIAFNKNGRWGSVEPIRYAGDIENGSSDNNDPRLGPDHRTIYFSSDRTVLVHFPRAHAQAVEDEKRLEAWDNGATNVWMIPLNSSG